MLSFDEWMSSNSANQSPLVLPEFTYYRSGLSLNDKGKLSAQDFLSDYYSKMASSYLPELDQFASSNAGKMVAYDPNKLMSIEDFGLGTNRGSHRNVDLLQSSHDLSPGTGYESNDLRGFYFVNNNGKYDPVFSADEAEGKDLYQLTYGFDGSEPVYTEAGKYHKETLDEAIDRLIGYGGSYKIDGQKGGYDFMGQEALSGLSADGGGKWGPDYMKDPTMVKLLNDPNYVTRDENGAIKSIRAELYPHLFREQLAQEYRDIARGGTKEAGGFGDIVKALIVGVGTGGLGLAGASALGLGSAAAGAGIGATAAGMGYGGLATAGAISGALSSALTGGDILKGALTGGISGGLTKFASPYVSGALSKVGIQGGLNSALTGGLTSTATGGLTSAIMGNKFNPLSSFAGGATQGYLGSKYGKEFMGDLGITNPIAQKLVGNVASGTVGSLAAGKSPNIQNMLMSGGMMSFQDWLNNQAKG